MCTLIRKIATEGCDCNEKTAGDAGLSPLVTFLLKITLLKLFLPTASIWENIKSQSALIAAIPALKPRGTFSSAMTKYHKNKYEKKQAFLLPMTESVI